jgi:hypothetical protein
VVAVAAFGSPPPAPASPTTTTIVVPTPTTAATIAWPELDLDSLQERRAVNQALDLVAELDPAQYARMEAQEKYWTVDDCDFCGDALGQTDPDYCVTEVDLDNVKAMAVIIAIPERYWLASVLVHEWTHCRPGAHVSERPSIRAQMSFAKSWPEPYKTRALFQGLRDLNRLNPDGTWKS